MQGCTEIYGVDVAKDEVVVAMHGQTHVRTLANELGAIDTWLATLPRGSIIAMESTGVYHQLLAQRAHAAGMQVYVLNARDVHFYAKALGARGKTDRVDAARVQEVGEQVQDLAEAPGRVGILLREQPANILPIAYVPQPDLLVSDRQEA